MRHRPVFFMPILESVISDNDITVMPDDNNTLTISRRPESPVLEWCESIKAMRQREYRQHRQEMQNLMQYHNRIKNINYKGRRR